MEKIVLGSFKTGWKEQKLLWDSDINLIDLDDFKSAHNLQQDPNGDIKDFVFHVFSNFYFKVDTI